MADNINERYYQPALGTLAGFSVIPTPVDPISKTGWSIDQLRAFLRNEDNVSFPSVDWMQELEKLIGDHLGDLDNPHRVTLDQLMENITKDIIGGITPGTVPDSPPFFAYDAEVALPLNTIFPATYGTTNLYRRSEAGRYVNPADEIDVMGVDSSSGSLGVPLFSQIRNDVPTTWRTDPALHLNTTLFDTPFDAVHYPFGFTRVNETFATGEFGISVPVQETAATAYTMTIFLVPLYVDGHFIIRRPDENQSVMRISIDDASVEFSSNAVSGNVTRYPDGVFKVSYSYLSPPTAALRRIEIVQQDLGDATTTRVGDADRMLFLFAQPIVAGAAVGYPLPIAPSVVATCQPFVPLLNRVAAPPTLANLTVSIALTLHPLSANAVVNNNNLLSFGLLQLTRDATNVYLKYNNQIVFTSAILFGLNVFSFSMSPTLLAFKDLANPTQSISGGYAPAGTAVVTVGPCGGYLQRLAFYAETASPSCLEFLTNG